MFIGCLTYIGGGRIAPNPSTPSLVSDKLIRGSESTFGKGRSCRNTVCLLLEEGEVLPGPLSSRYCRIWCSKAVYSPLEFETVVKCSLFPHGGGRWGSKMLCILMDEENGATGIVSYPGLEEVLTGSPSSFGGGRRSCQGVSPLQDGDFMLPGRPSSRG